MARVAIVGPGAIGGFFAAQAVASRHHRVVLCGRRSFDTLVLKSPTGNIETGVRVHTDPSDVGVVDWVFLATKTYQTTATKPWLEVLCSRSTVVVVLQNGVEHVERVSPLVPEARVVPATVFCNARVDAPGRVVHSGGGYLVVPQSSASEGLPDIFAGTAASVQLTRDFATVAWTKLCRNVAANALTAITGQRLGILRRPDVASLARGLIAECIAVGNREGARFEDRNPDEVVDLSTFPADGGSSMLDDRLAGRPLEHEALNGAVVRIGARHGLPVPLNGAVLALLAAISDAQPCPA